MSPWGSFQGRVGETVPKMEDDFVRSVSERYIELFQKITGDLFVKSAIQGVEKRIEENVMNFLENN